MKPLIDVLKITENTDGSATLEVEYGKEFVEIFKLKNPTKRATKKNLSDFLIECLTASIESDISQINKDSYADR